MVKDKTRKVLGPDWEGRAYYCKEFGVYDIKSGAPANHFEGEMTKPDFYFRKIQRKLLTKQAQKMKFTGDQVL